MSPLSVLLEIVRETLALINQANLEEAKKHLDKMAFEIMKRMEVEAFNSEELTKLRMELKHQQNMNTGLVMENNKLKQMINCKPED